MKQSEHRFSKSPVDPAETQHMKLITFDKKDKMKPKEFPEKPTDKLTCPI